VGREPFIFVSVGKRGCGKTFTSTKMINDYVKGNPAKGVPPRRALILDVNDEFTQYKAISVEQIPLFSIHPIIECRRVRPFLPNGKKMTLDEIAETLSIILDTYKNGLLLIEDVNKYISDSMPNDLIGAICTNRHIGVDIILHYQSIGRINTKVWQNVNIIRMHKFTDTVKRHKQKFEDKYEFLSIAETIINKKNEQGDKRCYVFIDIDNEKIFGNFTNEEMEIAVNDFIQKNYQHLINPLLNARDDSGNKINTPQSANAEVRNRLMDYRKTK